MPWRCRPASIRPAGLALSTFKLRKLRQLQEEITDVQEAGGPRRGRPAPPCSHSSLGFAWKFSSTVTTASNRRHVLHLIRTDLGRTINRTPIHHL